MMLFSEIKNDNLADGRTPDGRPRVGVRVSRSSRSIDHRPATPSRASTMDELDDALDKAKGARRPGHSRGR